MTCGHKSPTFGCLPCIKADRDRFAETSYRLWKSVYKLPKCKSCGEKMIHYGKNTYPSKVEAIIICPMVDNEGCASCEDEDLTVVIA